METIVVAVDFSPSSERAFQYAVEQAARLKAAVHAVYVINTTDLRFALKRGIPVDFESSKRTKAKVMETIDKQFADLISKHGQSYEAIQQIVLRGDPADEVLRHAEEAKASMIVVGTRGLSPTAGLVLGSVAQEIIRCAACPVVTLRA